MVSFLLLEGALCIRPIKDICTTLMFSYTICIVVVSLIERSFLRLF
jgi:hypothetical protein